MIPVNILHHIRKYVLHFLLFFLKAIIVFKDKLEFNKKNISTVCFIALIILASERDANIFIIALHFIEYSVALIAIENTEMPFNFAIKDVLQIKFNINICFIQKITVTF